MNNYEHIARITVEFDCVNDLFHGIVDAVDGCWKDLRDGDDCTDDIVRVRMMAREMRRSLVEFEKVCEDADCI